MKHLPCFFILLVSLFASGCLSSVTELYPENEDRRPVSVYVLDHGWHTAIALEGEHVSEKIPEHDRFPDSRFLMFGWGDNKYYPAERATVSLFLRAAFWPTGSVLHVAGFEETPAVRFSERKVVEIRVSEAGLDRMTEYIAGRFKLDEDGELLFSGDGLYSNSAFFKAKGTYYFPRTSNKWTARTLRKSGFPITPFYAITASNVMRQVSDGKTHGFSVRMPENISNKSTLPD